MDWSAFNSMDPHLLVGVVNTALRNHEGTLSELCLTHDIDPQALCAYLAQAGYDYRHEQHQFR